MSKSRLNRHLAWALLSVYASFGASWILHHAFSPEHRHCEADSCLRHSSDDDRSDGAQCDDECLICCLAPATAEISAPQDLCFFNPEFTTSGETFGERRRDSAALPPVSQPRAPPTFGV